MKEIDLGKLAKAALRQMLVNARAKDAQDLARRIVEELARRGLAERRDFDVFEWNQERVKACLEPFKAVSETVPGSKRTAYTEAGGLKIGRSKTDPLWKWVDSYSAIKTPNVNAVFVCYIDRPGDQPYFKLTVDGVDEAQFSANELEAALARWRCIAATASA